MEKKSHTALLQADGYIETGAGSNVVVIKKGQLCKVKSKKKKYVVLWKDINKDYVFLDYYDQVPNNKKATPKKCINISLAFAITRKSFPSSTSTSSSTSSHNSLPKNPYILNIYTWDESLSLICDDEKDLLEWYEALVNERASSIAALKLKKDIEGIPTFKYDFVWEVVMKNSKKEKNNSTSTFDGTYRICLESKMLYIHGVDSSSNSSSSSAAASAAAAQSPQSPPPRRPIELNLKHVRKVGHSGNCFQLETGRSSTIGTGILVMQAEDKATAQHMHETIRAAMQLQDSNSNSIRPRSSSSSDGSKQSRRSTLATIMYHPPSTQIQQATSSSGTPTARTPSTLTSSCSFTSRLGATSSIDQPDKICISPYSISGVENSSHYLPCDSASPTFINSSIYGVLPLSHATISSNSIDPFRDRTESLPSSRIRCVSEGTNSVKLEYTDVTIGESTSSLTPYKVMSSPPPQSSKIHPTQPLLSAHFTQHHHHKEQQGQGLHLQHGNVTSGNALPAPSEEDAGYLSMVPCAAIASQASSSLNHQTSAPVHSPSSHVIKASTPLEVDSSGYVSMVPTSLDQNQQSNDLVLNNGPLEDSSGYLNMVPVAYPGSMIQSDPSENSQFTLLPVKSFLPSDSASSLPLNANSSLFFESNSTPFSKMMALPTASGASTTSSTSNIASSNSSLLSSKFTSGNQSMAGTSMDHHSSMRQWRAYSYGSKPLNHKGSRSQMRPSRSSILAGLVDSISLDDSIRSRAHSTGSHGMKDIKSGLPSSANSNFRIDSDLKEEVGELTATESSCKESKKCTKSSSVPVLAQPAPRERSSTVGSRPGKRAK